ncbi:MULTISPECIES: hypothetical protein [Luteococcus]|uniref:Uncharacterized protein n=2 Tax=Luteococcus japonicus TaxID=33984 RepID=A0A1R4JHB4_9ACTN|nr:MULTISPECIES: hypothetical protein [Luteococcus]MDN5563595.1 hypothetical protein [Luteococcus sp.]SJN31143.1 hypothetical protein FM114_07425 [Luteococcus japonicus LSP_Lj1]
MSSEQAVDEVTGVRRQPAVAARTRALLVQLAGALLVSLIGLGCALMSSHTLMRLEQTSRLWPMVANLASILLVLVCLLQFHVWRQAQKEWTGAKDVSLMHLLTPSASARWVAVLCGLAGPWACLQMAEQTARQEQAHWWALACGVSAILATGFGGIHQFNPAGPRGVLPQRMDHARRVITADEERHVDPEADTIVLRREQPDG